jgi:hypothetical protein
MKVHDEDPAQVAQADLPGDLDDRFEVRREDRLLERVAADELSGVDVDRDEGLRLVDDDRPAGGKVHPGLQRALDLLLDAEPLEEGLGVFVELHARHQIRGGRGEELADLLEGPGVVHPDRREVGRHEVAQAAQRDVELAVQQQGPAPFFALDADALGETFEIALESTGARSVLYTNSA